MAQLLFIYAPAAPETYSTIGNFGESASVVMQGMGRGGGRGSLIKFEKFENYTEQIRLAVTMIMSLK